MLFVARRGGVSAEAVAALRESGRSWTELARRFGAVTYPLADGATEPTFRITASAPAGTPPRPVTSTVITDPPSRRCAGAPLPERVSSIRAGTSGTNPDAGRFWK